MAADMLFLSDCPNNYIEASFLFVIWTMLKTHVKPLQNAGV